MVGPGDSYERDDEPDAARAQQVKDARAARGKGKGKGDRMSMRGAISQGEAMRRSCETTYAYDEDEEETLAAASVSAAAAVPSARTRVSGGDPVADLERIVQELE